MKSTSPPNTAKKPVRTLLVFFVVFYLAWTIVELLLVPALERHIASEVWNTFFIDVLVKNLLWTLPALLLLRKNCDSAYISFKELFRLRKAHALWLLAVPAIAVYVILLAYFQNGGLSISDDFGMSAILVVLFVGLTEETVFRGWMLNITYDDTHQYSAILLNAVLFLAIHFPKWLRTGTFVSVFTSSGFLTILLLGALFGFLFVKSKSLVVPILTHSVYDLMVMMLF